MLSIPGVQLGAIRFQGTRANARALETALRQASQQASGELRVTEFDMCARLDPQLKKIDLISFDSHPNAMKLDSGSKIEVLERNASGTCAVARTFVLADLIREAEAGTMGSSIPARVTAEAQILIQGIDRDSFEVVSKKVKIRLMNSIAAIPTEIDSSVQLEFEVAPNEVYSIIDPLTVHGGGTLRVTVDSVCSGTAPGGAVRLLN